jgi:hypothetical protein
VAEHVYTFVLDLTDSVCDALPQLLCAAVCISNPAYNICKGLKYIPNGIAAAFLAKAVIAYRTAHHVFEKASLGANDALDGHQYAKATYQNTMAYNAWNYDALTQISTSMKGQHKEMEKKQIQDRQKDIANHIGEDIAEAQNALGSAIVDTQNPLGQAIVDARMCLE